MRVTHSYSPLPATQAQPSLSPMTSRSPAIEAASEHRQQDRVNTAATVHSTAMSFDINPGSNSMTVTLSDRTSGEVLRKLVYDHSGQLRRGARPKSGQMIDVAT